MEMLNTRTPIYLISIINCMMLWACSSNNTSNIDSRSQSQNQISDSTINNPPEEKYSIEEEQKVYGDVNFGISRNQYQGLIPKKVNKIGAFEFEFTPSFNHKGELYELSIKSMEEQQWGAMEFLVKLMEQKYGRPNTVSGSKNVPKGSELYIYIWNINAKQISIQEVGVLDQKFQGGGYAYKYPIMVIVHEKMKADFYKAESKKRKKVLENEANKF